jgi:F-type H+-transporting ATPase subunit delta
VRDATVARSYAEALLELGRRSGEAQAYADAFDTLDGLMAADPRVRAFLVTPKIDVAAKKGTLRTALQGRVPQTFLNFLMIVLDKRRQRIIAAMGREYRELLDEHLGRLNVRVTLAHEPDERAEREISTELSRILARQVVPHVDVDPAILGGVVVRYGDRLLDASLRRRLLNMRERLLEQAVPETV